MVSRVELTLNFIRVDAAITLLHVASPPLTIVGFGPGLASCPHCALAA